MRRFLLSFAACLVAVALLASPAGAATVTYTTFGPGDTYNTLNGDLIRGSTNYWVAAQFAPTTAGLLTLIRLGLSAGPYTVELLSDNAGAPGADLCTVWNLTAPGGISSIDASGCGYTLTAGQNYWLKVGPGTASMVGGWNINNQGISGPLYWNGGHGVDTLTAFELQVDTGAIPEPSSLLLVLPAPALLMLRRRRQGVTA